MQRHGDGREGGQRSWTRRESWRWRALYADHIHPITNICKTIGISRATLYRSLGDLNTKAGDKGQGEAPQHAG